MIGHGENKRSDIIHTINPEYAFGLYQGVIAIRELTLIEGKPEEESSFCDHYPVDSWNGYTPKYAVVIEEKWNSFPWRRVF